MSWLSAGGRRRKQADSMDFTPVEEKQALVGEAGVKQVRDAVIGRLRLV